MGPRDRAMACSEPRQGRARESIAERAEDLVEVSQVALALVRAEVWRPKPARDRTDHVGDDPVTELDVFSHLFGTETVVEETARMAAEGLVEIRVLGSPVIDELRAGRRDSRIRLAGSLEERSRNCEHRSDAELVEPLVHLRD